MKLRSVLFLLMMAVLLFFAAYTGGTLYYMLLVFLTLMLAISLVSLILVSTKFNYLQQLDHKIATKGDKVKLIMVLNNDSIFIFPSIQMEYTSLPTESADSMRGRSFYVMPRKNIQLSETLDCSYRGTFPIGLTRMYFSDIFGLFTFSRKLGSDVWQKPLSLTILPRVVSLPELPMPVMTQENLTPRHPRLTPDAGQIAGLREQQPGDSMRRIHWKATAKIRQIIVKEYEQQATAHPVIYMDTGRYEESQYSRLVMEDMLVETAVAILNHLLQAGHSTELVVYNPRRASFRGNKPADFSRFFNIMSSLRFRGRLSLSAMFKEEMDRIDQASCMYVITRKLEAEALDNLLRLSTSGVEISLFWIQDALALREEKTSNTMRMLGELTAHGVHVFRIKPGDALGEVVQRSHG